ncbi:MAG: hypothetical protein ACK5M3_02560 [Dysgonomonas sp.]
MDDYFDRFGNYILSTKTGSKIFIMIDLKPVSPSSLKTKWSFTEWNDQNRSILKNVYSYYAKQAGIEDHFEGITKKTSESLAFAKGEKIWISTQENGSVSFHFDDYNNLMSVMGHEKGHVDDYKAGIPISYVVHAKVYLNQLKGEYYKNGTESFREGIILKFFQYWMGAKLKNEDGWKDLLDDFNKSNINGGWKLIDHNSGGPELLSSQ